MGREKRYLFIILLGASLINNDNNPKDTFFCHSFGRLRTASEPQAKNLSSKAMFYSGDSSSPALLRMTESAHFKNIRLLASDAKGFDFRDSNNQPTEGDSNQTESLFLMSAFNLLALSMTPPRMLADSLLAKQLSWFSRFKLAAHEKAEKLIHLAAATGNYLKRLFAIFKTHPRRFSLPRALPNPNFQRLTSLVFKGAAVPLRL